MSILQNVDNKHAARAHLIISLINSNLTEADIVQDITTAECDCDDLYMLFDDDLPILDKSKWDLDYFYKQMGGIELVFSKERLHHLIEVRKYLRNHGVPELQYISTHNHVTDTGLEEKKFNNEPEAIKPKLKQPPPSRRISDSSTRNINNRNNRKI